MVSLATLAVAIAVIGRVLGPGDLYQNSDQCKTAAFTADMLLNGRWLVPVDLTGTPTLKPPLVNYLAAPSVALALAWDQPSELAFKLPSIVAALGGMVAVGLAGAMLARTLGRWARSDEVDHAIARNAGLFGVLCAVAWVASPSTIKHLYFCRPDMLQNTLLAWGWLGASVVITRPSAPRSASALMWASAGLAALAKGPMALLLPAYLVLGLLLLRPVESSTPRWKRAGLFWGPLLMLAVPAAWLIPAYIVEPEHITETLLAGEVGSRVSTGGDGLNRLPANTLRVPGFYVERFWPWSITAVIGLVAIGPRRLLRHPMSPAVLWVAMITLLLIVVAGESGSFNAPAYPAIAVLGVYGLVRVIAQNRSSRLGPALVASALCAVVVASVVVGYQTFFSRAAASQVGPRIGAFAEQAGALVDDDPVAFVGLGHNPLPLLMGRHPGKCVEWFPPAEAVWVVCPVVEGIEPVLVSEPIIRLKAGGRGIRERQAGIGLYKGGGHPDGPSYEPPN